MSAAALLEEYNYSPVRQIGIPGLGHEQQPMLSRILADPRSRDFLDTHLRSTLQWGEPLQELDGFLEIVALAAPRLARMARYVGVALCADLIRETVDGRAIRGIRQALGTDLMNFALYRHSLLRTASPIELKPKSWHEDPNVTVVTTGQRALLLGCVGYPAAVVSRTRIKLGVESEVSHESISAVTPIIRVFVCEVKPHVPVEDVLQ